MAKNKGRWGGRREGAGAPLRNLNALKHGGNSSYVQTLIQALAAHPTTRDVLIRLARRRRAEKRLAERTAAVLLRALLERALIALKNDQDPQARADTDRVLDAILQRNNQDADTKGENQSSSPLPAKRDGRRA